MSGVAAVMSEKYMADVVDVGSVYVLQKTANTNENKINVRVIENCIIKYFQRQSALFCRYLVWKHYFFPSVQKSRGLKQIIFGKSSWKEKTVLKEL